MEWKADKLTGTLDMQLSRVAGLMCGVNSPHGYLSFKVCDDYSMEAETGVSPS